jgi:hypothetical protein
MKKILIVTRDSFISCRQLPGGKNISLCGNYEFYINDYSCKPDYVVVFGKGLRRKTALGVPKSRTILITGEPYSVLAYPKGYCEQFGVVCSCQPEIKGDNVVYTPAILPWFVGVDKTPQGVKFPLDYDSLKRAQPEKTKLISVITSTKAFTQGHIDRIRFVEKLMAKYGDKVDVFGHGFHSFGDKWDVLAPYKYHIVIENSSTDYYWTEKLSDCFLAGTYPLYHGCKNVSSYYPEGSLTKIDIRHFDEAVAVIEKAIADDAFEKSGEVLQRAKMLTLDKYNMFTQLADICSAISDKETSGEATIQPASHFFNLHNLYLHTIGRNYYKLKNKIQ